MIDRASEYVVYSTRKKEGKSCKMERKPAGQGSLAHNSRASRRGHPSVQPSFDLTKIPEVNVIHNVYLGNEGHRYRHWISSIEWCLHTKIITPKGVLALVRAASVSPMTPNIAGQAFQQRNHLYVSS